MQFKIGAFEKDQSICECEDLTFIIEIKYVLLIF